MKKVVQNGEIQEITIQNFGGQGGGGKCKVRRGDVVREGDVVVRDGEVVVRHGDVVVRHGDALTMISLNDFD